MAQEANRNRNRRNRFPGTELKGNQNRRNRFSGTETGTGTGPSCQNSIKTIWSPFQRRNRRNRKPETLEPSYAGTVTESNRTVATLLILKKLNGEV